VIDSMDGGAPKEFVKVTVTDTGCGMPANVLARAFEPFFTTKDVNKGSGLGLPQVYGFAQQSGGRVSIESKVGDGTVVTVLLPRSTVQPESAADGEDKAHAGSTARSDGARRGQLLLVEDDHEVSSLTKEMLTSLGFSVIHVSSADAALGALANARAVDFVVSDIMMPGGVSGLQLAREIRRRYPHLPIALTTGYVESAAGMADDEFSLLLKPYTLDELAAALNLGLD
jgi:CheY-like chemotaxis protein